MSSPVDGGFAYAFSGYCPICEAPRRFEAKYPWYRDHLKCPSCGSVVRERAVAAALNELRPNWRNLAIHESSPSGRGVSLKLREQCHNFIASHYYPDKPFGSTVGRFRNENLEAQTFADRSFDIVVSLDVMEHVFRPDLVYTEVFRTLKPGGLYIHTFPIFKAQVEAKIPFAELDTDGSIRHLVEKPEYHGNPIDPKGSLVTFHYDYDIHRQIAGWAPFRVRICRAWDEYLGIIGEFTDVIVCERPFPQLGQVTETARSKAQRLTMAGASDRQALVIVGPHRAGTSAMAKALSLAGWALPKTLVPGGPGNLEGHYESLPIMRFNEAVLRGIDREWLDPKPLPESFSVSEAVVADATRLLAEEFGDAERILVKEPRISRLLPLWLAAFAELGIRPVFLFACRSAVATANSLARRDGFDIEHGLELWLTYVLEAEAASRGLPRRAIRYENLLADPAGTIADALAALSLGCPSDADTTAKLRQAVTPQTAKKTVGGASARLSHAVTEVEGALATDPDLLDPIPFEAVRRTWRSFWSAASPGDGASFLALGQAETHYGRSTAELVAGRPTAALAAARLAAGLAPDSPVYRTQIGIAATAAGEMAEAEAALRQALALDNANVTALHRLGQLALAAGRPDEARDLFERAATLAPQLAVLHLAVGQAAEAAGDAAAAARAFAKARECETKR